MLPGFQGGGLVKTGNLGVLAGAVTTVFDKQFVGGSRSR